MPSYAGPPVAPRPGEIASSLRLLAYLALGVALVILDHRGGWLAQARQQLGLAAQPLWWVAGLPGKLGARLQDDAATLGQLTEENRRLRDELLISNARLTRLSAAVADNAQLRALLGAAGNRGLDVQLAAVLNIDLDPTRQRLVIDAGSRDGVHVGQPVIDAGGLLGQIVQVMPTYSTVLLLTDPDHAVPVMVQRSGVRLLASGNGRSDQLQLVNVPLNADIKDGDVVVTSGLGGRFPPGFPVGTVADLHADDSRTFLVGELRPAAHLDRGRNVLLLKAAAAVPAVPNVGMPGEGPEAGGQEPAKGNGKVSGKNDGGGVAGATTSQPSASAASAPRPAPGAQPATPTPGASASAPAAGARSPSPAPDASASSPAPASAQEPRP
ncbi:MULTISPECIES: rod shape-determining protein MreC [Pseudoxanthomonas]|uniref:Cell shape-determining protein MreC n=1 Tax=Pseudoxanthomonas winnipegensis TaxID=2480810 RepID=A0AAW8GE50_9GAMM|nr:MULTISPECIES: rod shape-determining protein MreC [Pseudoxanthomonas]MDQ1120117.1 rod shape-determining protein MreC [Pseudoxanthomonas winnipegensis]MDQ1133327.1 rod shape-determining protein MreC [Pseudoxanthomonas winnipegensis]MDR6140427.1 rod shape-determining protein MreC [Pseudoxanthomonas sp. SORGH_AS_0997]